MSLSSTAGKRMHLCDFCDKLFSTASNLREHRRTHTGEKPFVCKYCGKAFAQSSTHSKHQLVHKNKELINGSRERPRWPISREQQEPRLTKLVEASTSEFRKELSLSPPETLNEREIITMKTEVESFHDSDWRNSNPVFDKQVDTSLHIESEHDDIQRSSPADQNPIITGMFKNRACELVSLPEAKNTSMKQEFFNVEEIGVASSSFLTEVDPAEDALTLQYEEAGNLEASALFIRETKTILCEESKEFTSVTPRLPVYSKGIGQNDSRIWNNRPKETSIIQLDLTLDNDDDAVTDVGEKLRNDTETFFKCIHCSKTFSSLEEHVCLAKEAKMFFKCQVCQKTFTQYGPFVRHKKTHENPNEFTVGSSSASKKTQYKTCGSTITIDLRKESSDISRMTDSFYLKEATEASCLIDLATASFQGESERIPSSTTLRLKEEERNENGVIIIEEDPMPMHTISGSSKDVPENRGIVGTVIEKNSTVFNLSNTDQVDHIKAGYIERSNRFIAYRNKPQRRVLSLETTSKSEMESGNAFDPVKRQTATQKTLQQIGKKVHPYTCLFCPRQFSTASNMREHMRTHTGEKPFSCKVCHKKFAQSSTRSKHMLVHKGYKLPGSLTYGKEILPRQTFEKQRDKTGNGQEKSFLLDRFANPKENPRINPTKTSSLKIPCTKSYSSLPNSKVCRQPLKRYAFKMPVEPSNNFSFPSKVVCNKFLSLNAKPSWRNGINKNNNFGYQKEEYKNRMNASHTKADAVLVPSNYQNTKTKTSFSPTVGYSSGSTTFTFGLSVENPKSKVDRLPPAATPTITTASMLPRPMSRCANKLLRNARTYRPFRCTYCPRTFSTSGNMKEHMRTHTGEKPFRCEYCYRRFAQSSTHSKHVLIHIRKQQLNCFFCGRIFSRVALLRDHIVSDHKTSPENHSRNIHAVDRLPRHSVADNETRQGLSLNSKVPSETESLLESDNRNQSFREEEWKRNEIIAVAESNLEEESNPVLIKKRFLETDLSTNQADYRNQERYDPGRSFQENKEQNDRKRDSDGIGKTLSKELQENVDSVIAKNSLISKTDLSSNLAEGTSVTVQLESEMVGKMQARSEWSQIPAKTRTLQQQPLSQIRSSTLPAFEADSIKTKKFELSSANKSGSVTYLAKNGNLIVDMEVVDNASSFAIQEEGSSNHCARSGGRKIDDEFRINYSYENRQLFNISDGKEAVNNCTDDNQRQKPIKLAPASLHNKNCDNNLVGVELQFKTTTDTNRQNEEYGESKVCSYGKTESHRLKVPSRFPNIDQSLMLSSSSPSDFISPVPANNTPIDCLPLKTEIDEINESGTDALRSSNNVPDDKYLIFSHVTDREQSASDIGSQTSLELARHQNEAFVDLNSDISNRRALGQNAAAWLNSKASRNSYNGDFSENFNWLLDVRLEPKSEREEPMSAFIERDNNNILGSKTDNSVQEQESVVLLPNIKLETNVHDEFYSEQVESGTNSSLTEGTMIDDSFGSGSHLKISEVVANVPFPFTDDIDENEKSGYNSEQFCDNIERFDTDLTSAEGLVATKLSKSRSSELLSAYRDNEKQRLTLNGALPNVVEKISKTLLERKRKNLLARHLAASRFKCAYCNRSFSSRSNMKEHTRIHTGEKPFECVFCSRRFAQSSTHSKHVQTHLRFKQLVCPQCGKRFLHANNLCQHIRAQHKNSSCGSVVPKRVVPHSEPLPPTAQESSDQTTQSSGNNREPLVGFIKNSKRTISVPNTSIELSDQTRQSSSNDEKPLVGFIKNNKPTISVPNMSIELSDDLPKMLSQSRPLKSENNSLINIDSKQINKITNINVPLANKTYLNSPDINFETTTELYQSYLPLNKSQTGLSKRNSDSQFSSEHSILNSVQALDTKINLQKLISDTFNEQSSDDHIYNKETFSELNTVCKSEKKDMCEASDACTSKSLRTPPLVSFTDVLRNDDSCGTLSSASDSKCEICSEVFYSEKLLYAHQRHHFANLAEQRGFDPKSFPIGEIGDLTSTRRFLKENKIKCYDDLEESFEKIVAVFGLEKLLKEPFCPTAGGTAFVQQIENKEMSENIRTGTEDNGFNQRHIVGKVTSTLPISGSTPSSTSSPHPPLLSSSRSSLHPTSFLAVCPEQTKNNSNPNPNPLLHFHRCLFCSKMFSSNANILKHPRNSMEDKDDNDISSISSKPNRTPQKYNTWYKHIAIVLRVQLRVLNQTVVENTQHLKIRFDVEERLRTLLHRRGLYRCRLCHKEYTTFRSLFFHRGSHSKGLTPQKLTQRIHTPKKCLRKHSLISMILSPRRISLNDENNCSAIGKHEKCPKISLPLLCFSLKDHFWITYFKGKLKAVHSDFQSLSVDQSFPPIEIESRNWLPLSDAVDSRLEKPKKSFSETDTETLALFNKRYRYDKENPEWPLHLFLNSFKDNVGIDLTDDDLNQKKDVQPKLDTQSAGVSNSGVVKMFGQEVTTMVRFQLEKCVLCGKLFTDVGRLERHLQFHAGKLPILCWFCPKSFTNCGASFRHKILAHFDETRKSCKNKKSEIMAGRKSLRLQKDAGSNFNKMKTVLESGVNLADADTVYVLDSVNKVLGKRRMSADFSDSTFGQKSSSEDSKMMSETVENPPRLSDEQVRRIRLKQSSEPFELEKNNSNGSVLENLQSKMTKLASGINSIENEYSNEPTQGIQTANNLETEVLSNVSDEDCIYVSSSSEPVYKNDVNVKGNGYVVGPSCSRQENDKNKRTILKQSICRAKTQFGLNPKFNKETSINSSFGNDFVLLDSNNGIQESNFKEDDLTDCIFINDDDDDYSPNDTSVLDAGSSTRQCLSDCNEKTNIANEIIILSDEENDDVSAQDFGVGNSLITLCDNTETFFGRPKEKYPESRPKVDGKHSKVFHESLDTCSQNSKTGSVNKPDTRNPNEPQNVQTILSTSLSPQVSSVVAANSSTMVDLENASCWSKSRPPFKEYRCLYCTKTCSSSSNLKEHMRRHTGERPFSCDVCHKTFAQKSTLSKHTQIHSRFKMLSSSENAAIHKSNYGIQSSEQISIRSPFDSVYSLDERLKSKRTSNVDTNLKSSIVTSITGWDTHAINSDISNTLNSRKRDDVKPIIDVENDRLDASRSSETTITSSSSSYYPRSTNKSIADWDTQTIDAGVSSNLINRMCNDLKPIIDVENDHADVQQSSLSSPYYATSTSDNDPFPSNSADFPPLTKSNSTQPRASNAVPKNGTFNKPYSCDMCNRMFSTVGNLKEHRRTHTGERPFECPFCEKTFAQASTRSRHVKNHSMHFVN